MSETREWGAVGTALAIFAIGAFAGTLGDACHVTSGTMSYPDDVARIWHSAFWFPFLLGGAVLAGAFVADHLGLASRAHTRADVPAGVAAIVALYALTATMHGEATTVSVVLCGAVAVLIWRWWDPGLGALALACVAAIAGPIAEGLLAAAGAATYAPGSDGLRGVPPWLPCLYFAAGAVASGLWPALARDGRPRSR